MRRLRDFQSIRDFCSDREIDELQAAVDARREARARRAEDPGPPAPEPRTRAGRIVTPRPA
ncbi:MAG: hypothetical protein AVDCRST_MAG01-01-1072 [uncultured Rubrobacteraceae bacterium]|uniref:Uncharacterized protein n=1 Tax=uncultured Rubrobacteraceae bacterium TaxID=349277 RepID=A0A6J4P0G2_9ACTN|nr:MAG: hypothetical protein AVDCRST_MAG01-01-1072 [uncultured Rubrobacteraceae bacterium]